MTAARPCIEYIDLTGVNAVPPGGSVVKTNPTGRIPHTMIIDRRSGDEKLDTPSIGADIITFENPSLTEPNESMVLVWYWHSQTR